MMTDDPINARAAELETALLTRTTACFNTLRRGLEAACTTCRLAAACAAPAHHAEALDVAIGAVTWAFFTPAVAVEHGLKPYEWQADVPPLRVGDLRGDEVSLTDTLRARLRDPEPGSSAGIPIVPAVTAAPSAPAVPPIVAPKAATPSAGPAIPVVPPVEAKPVAPIATTAAGIKVVADAENRVSAKEVLDADRFAGNAKLVPWPPVFVMEAGGDRRSRHVSERHPIDWYRAPTAAIVLPDLDAVAAGQNPYEPVRGHLFQGDVAHATWEVLKVKKAGAAEALAVDVARRVSGPAARGVRFEEVVRDALRDLALFGLVKRLKVAGTLIFKITA